MKKVWIIFFCLMSTQLGAQDTCCNRRDVEQYAIDILEKSMDTYKIKNSNDIAVFIGFYFKGGKLQNTTVIPADSMDSARQVSLRLQQPIAFTQYLLTEAHRPNYSGWIFLPVLFKYTTSEDNPKTVAFSQDIYRYMMNGVADISTRFRNLVFLSPFITFYGATYY